MNIILIIIYKSFFLSIEETTKANDRAIIAYIGKRNKGAESAPVRLHHEIFPSSFSQPHLFTTSGLFLQPRLPSATNVGFSCNQF